MRHRYLVPALLWFFALTAAAAGPAETRRVRSPGQQLEVTFALGADGAPQYSVTYRQRQVIAASGLGVDLGEAGKLAAGFRIAGERRNAANRHYPQIAGKASVGYDRYNELDIDLTDGQGRQLGVVLRAYDDGVALRYRLPRPSDSTLTIRGELTGFAFPSDYACWALNLGRFGTSHEGEYDPIAASRLRPHNLIELPLVCRTDPAGTTLAIAEADLDRYAGLYLTGRADGTLGVEAKLSPRLDNPQIAVRLERKDIGSQGFQTPWRVIMLGDAPGKLIESDLIANLNPPTPIQDSSWIRPGKSAWDWWSGGLAPDVPNAGMNDATMRRYIDHAAALSLEYMLIDDGWYQGSTGDGRYHADADITRSIAQIDLPGLVRYGAERGVGIWVWAHWQALDQRMEEALAYYQKLGIKGIKVDFMDRDDQDMVAFYHRLLAATAKHRLMLNLHGAYRPTGLNRTWPQYLTQEGVLGAEYNKWTHRITATHNLTLPFTRMLLGPMDYTPGGFRNVRPEDFQPRHIGPMVMTTRAHQLAMYVVYESPFAVVADSPDAYAGDAASIDFLRQVPTSWDETRVLSGEIGEYIAVMRRKGGDWYIGAMTNESARTLELPLDFLPAGPYEATVYLDGKEPADLRRESRRIDAPGPALKLPLSLAASGGAVVRLTPPSSIAENTQRRQDWANLARYEKANRDLPPGSVEVVFMGDSITEGWYGSTPSFFASGRVGRGISGQTTPQMLLRFRQDVIDLQPKAVHIMAGTNDIAGNTGPMTLEQTQANLMRMTEQAQAHGVAVILAAVPPASGFPWRPGLETTSKIEALNRWIRDYAQRAGAVYVDYAQVLGDGRGGMRAELSSDGVHPNARAYELMRPQAEAALREALKR
jgi:alpha-glucosidase